MSAVATVVTKKPATAGEIDAWCTKCRLDLNHRIVAMVDDKVKKVLCLTCKTEHNFHKPKNGPVGDKRIVAKATSARGGRTTAAEREAAAQKAERVRVASWERAIAGQPANAFRSFRITESFSEGELVRHTKFGDGVVTRVVDRQKVEILFQDGPRTMAHTQTV